jgi:hypothetical protein
MRAQPRRKSKHISAGAENPAFDRASNRVSAATPCLLRFLAAVWSLRKLRKNIDLEVLDADADAAAKCGAVLLSAFRAVAIQHPHQWPDNLGLDAAAQPGSSHNSPSSLLFSSIPRSSIGRR